MTNKVFIIITSFLLLFSCNTNKNKTVVWGGNIVELNEPFEYQYFEFWIQNDSLIIVDQFRGIYKAKFEMDSNYLILRYDQYHIDTMQFLSKKQSNWILSNNNSSKLELKRIKINPGDLNPYNSNLNSEDFDRLLTEQYKRMEAFFED